MLKFYFFLNDDILKLTNIKYKIRIWIKNSNSRNTKKIYYQRKKKEIDYSFNVSNKKKSFIVCSSLHEFYFLSIEYKRGGGWYHFFFF